jgi:toxin YoeB
VARHVAFTPAAWADYVLWQDRDESMLERINELIRECQRDPIRGIGKPEPLKRELAGRWSRRIDKTHRLVYRVGDDGIVIVSCRFHYADR